MQKVFLFMILAGFIAITSCGPQSKKGQWTDADKKKAHEICSGALKEELDKSEDIKKLGIDVNEAVKKGCDCTVKKAEAQYESLTAADSDEEGMMKIGTSCGEEVFGEMMKNKSE